MRKWFRKLIGTNPSKVMAEIGEFNMGITRGSDNMGKIFEVNGEEYEVVDREVREGDLIVVTPRGDNGTGGYYDIGHIGKVTEVYDPFSIRVDFNGFNNPFVYRDGIWYVGDDTGGNFVVLEERERASPQTDRDLIIELAYTVAKLGRKVERLEETLEQTDVKSEMLIDDVVMLDERTRDSRDIPESPAHEAPVKPRSKDDIFNDAMSRVQRSYE